MDSFPILSVLEQSQVSPPAATVGKRSLPLTFFDFRWLSRPPVHLLYFYELPVTKSQFTATIVPHLKKSLSITLQHFFPFVGKLMVFPSSPKKPEIRYVEGDSLAFTSAQCNLDFNDLTGNHPRDCDQFYPLIPLLKCTANNNESEFITIPVFSVQVTLFPKCGFSIGMTSHHSLGDASSVTLFLKAWTSISRSGTDELFLANGTLPIYDRLIKYPQLDEIYLNKAKVVETFNHEFQPPSLSGPTHRVRATFILARTVINRLKKLVSTQIPTISYISSFTVACAYTWSCMAESRNDELQLFGFFIDCRGRMDPPIPEAYFGNCVIDCVTIVKTNLLKGKEGFVNAAKLLGENLHKIWTDKDGVVKHILTFNNSFADGTPTTIIGVAATPKIRFYDIDFGWGNPRKFEIISIDYNHSISINSSKESSQDMEIGVCLGVTEMDTFDRLFNHGVEACNNLSTL